MNALILVGGEGTRLRPLTYDTPKPMLPIVERPIIARIVEWLARHSIERAVLSLGYRPDDFVRAFPTNEWEGVKLSYAVEPEPLDTAGAIRFAAYEAGLVDEPLVIVNGDILTDLDLDELVSMHRSVGAQATIALTPVEDPSAFGVVPTDESGRVEAFVEKPAPGKAPTNFINAGTYVFEPAVLARIAKGRRVSVEREIFPAMVEEKVLYAMASSAYWIDTGSPQRYLQAQLDVLSGVRPEVILPVHDEPAPGIFMAHSAHCEGELSGLVFVGERARVEKGATLANCVVGADCVVRRNSTLSNSVLLRGASLDEGASCLDSILGAGAFVGSRAVVRAGSVVGPNQAIEPGAVLDSARVPV